MFFVSFLLCVNKKRRHVDTVVVTECRTENGTNSLSSCTHSAAQHKKRLSPKTEGFVVIWPSNLDPYQDGLLYVHVINSSRNGFFSLLL